MPGSGQARPGLPCPAGLLALSTQAAPLGPGRGRGEPASKVPHQGWEHVSWARTGDADL